MLALGRKVRTRVLAILSDACGEGAQPVVLQLVVQFVEEFYADNFTVRPLRPQVVRPVQTMGLQQHSTAVHIAWVQRRSDAHIRNTFQWHLRQAMPQYRE